MRVLIAEDELLERKAMCKFINSNFSDLQIVGEAVNGREAIELGLETKPDIILMDIKMPGINGLDAVEAIMKTDDHMKFILISAYDSFSYAKQAMKFGIKEYILKPGKKVEMIRAIRRVQKEIEAERALDEEKRVSAQLAKDHLLTKLTKHPVDKATKRVHQQYFPQADYGYFLAIQISAAISDQAINQTLERVLPSTFIAGEQRDFRIVCVFTNDKAAKKDILQVARCLYMKWGKGSVIGVSHSKRIHDLPTAYQEAFTACYELGNSSGRSYGFFEQQLKEYQDASTSLINLISRGKAEDATAWFQEHAQEVKDETFDELYVQIHSILAERGLPAPGQHLKDLTSDKAREHWISVCSLKLEEYHQSQQCMEKAKQFIKQNYSYSISLEETAAYVRLSPNYFSNLFKQECGVSFIDYLTRIRLQKAKELLEGHDYSLKEISAFVGYNDPNYFSRVFKKHFAESPTRFQQTIVKK